MTQKLYSHQIDTPLGSMIAIGDDAALYLLEFIDRKYIERQIEGLQKRVNIPIEAGSARPITFIQQELKDYFAGQLKQFKTPIHFIGSPFQIAVWQALQKIPFGETVSYQRLATSLDKPTAYRAAANANAVNRLAIIVPCHRVIQMGGTLGGYAGGVARKAALLEHEKKNTL